MAAAGKAKNDARRYDGSKMMFHLCAARILARCSALAFMTVALGHHAHAEGKLDASYTISFARIRVGDITATSVVKRFDFCLRDISQIARFQNRDSATRKMSLEYQSQSHAEIGAIQFRKGIRRL